MWARTCAGSRSRALRQAVAAPCLNLNARLHPSFNNHRTCRYYGSTTVMLCPGQGSQFPGMAADLARDFPVVRRLLGNIDDALEFGLSKLMFSGTMDDLTPTAVAQPSILAHSLAVLAVLESEAGFLSQLQASQSSSSVRSVLGHSLGEFTALAAIGCFDDLQAVRLVRYRGICMAACTDATKPATGMLALHMPPPSSAEQLAAIAAQNSRDCVVVANYNSPKQTVLSGTLRGLEIAERESRKFGIRRTTRLPVSAAFHSPLLSKAQPQLREALESWAAPRALGASMESRIAWIPNVTAFPTAQASPQLITDLLTEQVVAPVRWAASVEAAFEHARMRDDEGMAEMNQPKPQVQFMVPGPGDGLARLLKDFPFGNSKVHVLSTVSDVVAYLHTL